MLNGVPEAPASGTRPAVRPPGQFAPRIPRWSIRLYRHEGESRMTIKPGAGRIVVSLAAFASRFGPLLAD